MAFQVSLHPWSLLIGFMFAAASLVSWLGPDARAAAKIAAKTGARRMSFDLFISRFTFPLLAGMFVFGAVAASSEVLPDNIWFHALLVVTVVAELVGIVLPLVQRRQPKRT